jgi:hypothetical protein
MSPLFANDRSPICGPLHAHINAYLKLLEKRGYKQSTIRPDSLLLADLDDWLVRKGHRVIDLNETMLERFLRYHMRQRHSRRQAKRAALVRLLVMLRRMDALLRQRSRRQAQHNSSLARLNTT